MCHITGRAGYDIFIKDYKITRSKVCMDESLTVRRVARIDFNS